MKKILLFLGVVFFLVVLWWLVSPLFIEKRSNESLDDLTSGSVSPSEESPATREQGDKSSQDSNNQIEVLTTGSFSGLAGHNASGTASLIKTQDAFYVRFEDDFDSTNGPDVRVYLGKNNQYDPNAELGAIKGNVGGQNYQIPSQIDPNQYDEVWLWCRAFSVPFGKAVLKE